MTAMTLASSLQAALADGARALALWLRNWWRVVHLGLQWLALALTPSTWTPSFARALMTQLVLGTAASLAWFTVLAALLSLVVIRIVLVTAVSYGLTQYALEMMVRVLVLELIPLTAALFAALRCTLPRAAEAMALRETSGAETAQAELLPRVIAGFFCALLLAAISCGLTLALAYVAVYGFTGAGFEAYTRTVGHVFGPGLSLVFALKIAAMALAVAVLPLASVLIEPARSKSGTSAELKGVIRMFFAILVIEGASLVGNYY